ncbi:Hypothetical predicted protein [Xyrichtys novacula]|uniref:Uncharacterized protein n=1 Tax=Xyrichtys novacula TaxID=13765 RepID=A0AAV1FJV6_XYRNO|nr:Hypothetical predicted protein [Xyrichtys novacula]
MQDMITQQKKKKNKISSLTPSSPSPSPWFPKPNCISLYSLLFPADYPSLPPHLTGSLQHPHTRLLSTFSSSPISSAIIPFFHFSLAQLIGHVCTVTWGPDIIAGQILRRLASDLSQLSCTQTPADWKA